MVAVSSSVAVAPIVHPRLSSGRVAPVSSVALRPILQPASFGGACSYVRFWRSPAGCWVLAGVPRSVLLPLLGALSAQGSLVATGCSVGNQSGWVAFVAPLSLVRSLYRSFPHPHPSVVWAAGLVGGPGWSVPEA